MLYAGCYYTCGLLRLVCGLTRVPNPFSADLLFLGISKDLMRFS